jgi:hypothetical protein
LAAVLMFSRMIISLVSDMFRKAFISEHELSHVGAKRSAHLSSCHRAEGDEPKGGASEGSTVVMVVISYRHRDACEEPRGFDSREGGSNIAL